MASSELEVEPDLKKAPPHVEGELLKQNTKSILGKKSWKKYYFIVLKDKLQYFDKRDDSKQNKEPVAFIRMSQVTGITEVIFNGVPKKHHLNCGFSVEAFHPVSQQQITLNLLAESPEDMRYWVHALRYIKAYWAKKMIRETVLNEEQERRILERILSGDMGGGEDELIPGEYNLDEELQSSLDFSSPSCPVGSAVSVYFADGSRVKTSLLPTDTTSDLLEKGEVKDRLTSSTAFVWLVDNLGNDMILSPSDHPALFPGRVHKLFALDHSHRVLPIFVTKRDYECIVVSAGISASQVIEHPDISKQLDLHGVTNRGLFLKSETEECMFTGTECPCDVLFDEDESRNLVRQDVGKLVIHNKSIGGGRGSNVTKQRLRNKKTFRTRTFRERRLLEEISEEEEAQSKALDMLILKKRLAGGSEVKVPSPKLAARVPNQYEMSIDGEQWVVAGSDPNSPDHRGFEDKIGGRKGSSPPDLLGTTERRNRSTAISDGSVKGRSGGSRLNSSPAASPAQSPSRGRSKSPRRLPEPPSTVDGSSSPHSSPLQRRNATRGGSLIERRQSAGQSSSDSATPDPLPSNSNAEQNRKSAPVTFQSSPPTKGKGPTIRMVSQTSPATSDPFLLDASLPHRNRSPTFKDGIMESINRNMVKESRSSGFGYTLPAPEKQDIRNLSSHADQSETAPLSTLIPEIIKTSEQDEITSSTSSQSLEEDTVEPLRPFVIDFSALQVAQVSRDATGDEGKGEESCATTSAPINVTSPNLLKVVILQSSEPSDITVETRPMDLISLSGVVLCNRRGVWHIQQGCNFHDELPFDSDSHTETFNLSGGIKAIYNHTHKRWHVLPPGNQAPPPSGSDADRSMSSSMETTQESLEQSDGSISFPVNQLYLAKKVIVTAMGSAFHDIVNQFGQTRDNAEKKRIGSDMTNAAMGHLIRGKFCSALANLLLDGLRPYRLQGIIQDDVWAVTMAFCNAAQSDPTSSLVTPAMDKLIFQPIHSMKAQMKDNHIKFRTFVCLAMSKGMLTGWLEALPKQRSVLRKYYLPSGFLFLVAGDAAFQGLYQEMLLTLEPMAYLPFDLSIDFEQRQLAQQGAEERGTTAGSGEANLVVAGMTEEPPSPQSSLRPNVVIKTHAATGQRSAAGNTISAVWDTSTVQNSPGSAQDVEGTSSAPQTDVPDGGIKQEVVVVHPAEQKPLPLERPPPLPEQQQAASSGRGGGGGGFLKKLSVRFQQLNVGGAITGAPKGTMPSRDGSPAHRHPQNTSSIRQVEALYTNICDDNDELPFFKGDVLVVKEQINPEWLICSRGNRTGIVPMNYIKPVVASP